MRDVVNLAAQQVLGECRPLPGDTTTIPLCVADVLMPQHFAHFMWPINLLKSLEGRTIKAVQLIPSECDDWVLSLSVELEPL